MKSLNSYIYSFVGPLMVILSIIGFTLRDSSKKIFYLPIGLMGIFVVYEKEFSRRLNRKNILTKIKSFQKNK